MNTIQDYRCDVCDALFADKKHYKIHMTSTSHADKVSSLAMTNNSHNTTVNQTYTI